MKEYLCERCGHVTRYGDDYQHYGGWQPVERRRLHSGLAAPIEAFTEYERIHPAKRPTVQGFFSTPLLQSLACGFSAGLVSIPIVIYMSWAWWWPLVAAGLGFSFSWLLLLRYFNSLLVSRETVRNEPQRIINQQPAQTVRLEVTEGHTKRFAELPIEERTLRQVARAILAGRAFSVASMCGRGKPLTRGQYEELRDWLLKAGYLKWIDEANRQAGVEFTAKGKALLKGLAS